MVQRAVSVASQAPETDSESTERRASSGVGPRWLRGGLVVPIATPAKGPGVVVAPTIRSSHPVRSDEPGAARSISSMSVKWERVGFGCPTACTRASLFAVQNGRSGARAGCRAKRVVSGSPRDCGTAMLGRAV